MKYLLFVLFAVLSLSFIQCSPGSAPEVSNTKPAGQPELSGEHPTVSWILACRVRGQGFGEFPGDSAFVSRTGMALDALAEMGELAKLTNRAEIVGWLQGMQQSDGGFIEHPDFFNGKNMPWGTQSALQPTYWAVKALNMLGAEPLDPDAAVKFIAARRRDTGSYDAYEMGWGGTRDATYSTFWAVGALKILGSPVPDSTKVIEFLQSMQDTWENRGGFCLDLDNWRYSSAPGTQFAVKALDVLGAEPKRPAAVKEYLLTGYGQEADGGFEIGHGDNWNNYDHYSLTQDTYGAVLVMQLLGMPLSDSDSSRAPRPKSDCIAWLKSIQNRDGGFARVGVTEQTPVVSPSEMRATWQAVKALALLGADIPRPAESVAAVNEVQAHTPKYIYPTIKCDDPADVWAYRRIAKPIYDYYLNKTGSRIQALNGINKWVRAVVGPENASYLTGGRGVLHMGWGQCGQMSNLLQELAISVDHAARFTFVIGDVNCEILVQEDGWDKPHWLLFIPFTNEIPNPEIAAADGTKNGWSLLDCVIDYHIRHRNLNYPSRTELGDHLFSKVRIETIDFVSGQWGKEVVLDSSTTYQSENLSEAYSGTNW